MRKIPCVFVRDFERHSARALDQITSGCEWVLAGEGIATRKWDGTAALVREGKIYARYDAKAGKIPPADAIPCDPEPDPVTGHWPHWILVGEQPEYRWHAEALQQWITCWGTPPEDGTYEAVGPKISGNPEGEAEHRLHLHGAVHYTALQGPRSFASICEFLTEHIIEGLVFHHDDGRMAKIRRGDFGLMWPVK